MFSNALVSPVPRTIPRMTVSISDWIMRNVPPARVWTYRRPALADLEHIGVADETAPEGRAALAVFDSEKTREGVDALAPTRRSPATRRSNT